MAEGTFMVGGEAAMFRTIRHAEIHITTGKAVRIVRPFLLPEGLKTRGGEKFVEIILRDISEFPFWKNMEITGIDIAIVFDDEIVAAVAAHGADGGTACGET